MAGGGIGEAMLIGAAMGGGSAAVTGGDPLKGALLGGLTGGAGAGIGGALAGGAEAATLASSAGGAGGTAGGVGGAAGTAAQTAAQVGTGAAIGTGAPTIANAQGIASLSSGAPTVANAAAANTAATTSGASGFNNMFPSPNEMYQAAIPSASTTPLYTPPPSIVSPAAFPATGGTFTEGMARFADNPLASIKANPFTAGASALAGAVGGKKGLELPNTNYNGPLSRFRYNPDTYRPAFAEGGITALASGGYDRVVGEEPMYPANMASGGISNLGTYSDGGRMLRGPGDGMSDSIPGVIGDKRPARLADGEFVVPADVVSHLGNGSTDAGAKHLYSMMDKVRTARTGRKAQGREINSRQYMPG